MPPKIDDQLQRLLQRRRQRVDSQRPTPQSGALKETEKTEERAEEEVGDIAPLANSQREGAEERSAASPASCADLPAVAVPGVGAVDDEGEDEDENEDEDEDEDEDKDEDEDEGLDESGCFRCDGDGRDGTTGDGAGGVWPDSHFDASGSSENNEGDPTKSPAAGAPPGAAEDEIGWGFATGATSTASRSDLELFQTGLTEAQRAAFSLIVAEHEIKHRKLEEENQVKSGENEFLKGETTSQRAQILVLLEAQEKRQGAEGAPDKTAAVVENDRNKDVAALQQEVAELRVQLGAAETATLDLGWQKKGKKGKSPLKKLNRALSRRK